MRGLLAIFVLSSVCLLAVASATEEEGYVYDENGFLVQLVDGDGTYVTIVNDENGDPQHVVDELGNVLIDLTEEASGGG